MVLHVFYFNPIWDLSIFLFVISFSSIFFSFWYRITLKASAAVWLPIVFLAVKAPRTVNDVRTALLDEKETDWAKMVRIAALVSVVFFLCRLLVIPSIAAECAMSNTCNVLIQWMRPGQTAIGTVNLWHIAAGVNGGLTLILYFVLYEPAALTMKRGAPGKVNALAVKIYRPWYWLRGALSTFTIGCSLYFAYRISDKIHVAGFTWIIFE